MLGCGLPRARQPSMGSALQAGITGLRLDSCNDACPRSAPRPAAAPESPRTGPAAADAGRFRGQPLAGRTRHLGLGFGLLRSRSRGRAGRLVRRGRAVPAADGPADSAHRDHPAQQGAHRRQPGAVRARPVPEPGVLLAKLQVFDPASRLGSWLADPARSRMLADMACGWRCRRWISSTKPPCAGSCTASWCSSCGSGMPLPLPVNCWPC